MMNFMDTMDSFRKIDDDFNKIIKRQSLLDEMIRELDKFG